MRSLACLVLCTAIVACLHGCAVNRALPAPELSALSSETACMRATHVHREQNRIAGELTARMGGIEGLLGSMTVDLVVERPNRIVVALRSFFEQPLQMIATNGEDVTIFDATSPTGPRYYRGPATPRTMALLLPVPLAPQELTSVFLGVDETLSAGCALQHVDERHGTYDVIYPLPDGRRITERLRARDDAIVSADFSDPVAELTVHALMSEHRPDGSGRPFPRRWALTMTRKEVSGRSRSWSVTLEAKDLAVNGPPYPDETFILSLPEGELWRPIPAGEDAPLAP